MGKEIENTEILDISENNSQGFDLSSFDKEDNPTMWVSFPTESEKDKRKLYNALQAPTYKLRKFYGKEINMKDFVIEIIQITNEQTGEITDCPRIIIIDENGDTYSCVSIGVLSSLKKITSKAFYGKPPFKNPIKVIPQEIETNNARRTTILGF